MLKEITDALPLIVSLLVSLVGLISAIIKIIKEKKWNDVKSTLCDFIVKAEESEANSGEEKKNLVLNWAQDFCQKQGYKFDANQVSAAIEKLLDFSKKVNAKTPTEPNQNS